MGVCRLPSCQGLSSYEAEKNNLRRDANYIGFVMLAMTLAMQTVYIVVVTALVAFGVLSSERLSHSTLGMDNTTYLLFYAAIYTFAMGVPAVIVSLIAGKRHFPLSPARRVNAGDAFYGVLASLGVCMLANVVASYFVAFFESLGAEDAPPPSFLEPNSQSLLVNIVVFALLPALLEEMVFRGYVLRALRRYGDWSAIVVSAVLFGLMHGNISQIPFALIVGLALGWLYVATENIWLAVSVHFTNNAFSFLLEYLSINLDDASKEKFYGISIFAITALGVLCVGVLIARRSSLFRRLPHKTPLTMGARIGVLLTAPALILSVLVFIVLLIMECFL